jgi:MFS family permease
MLAVISLMWALGNVSGPGLGGVFAQLGQWRLGFLVMVVAAVAIALLALRSLPAARGDDRPDPLPLGSLLFATAGAAAVSVAGLVPKGTWTVLMLLAAAVLVGLFLARERRSEHRILPAITYTGRSPLRWYYLGVAGLTVGLTAETFVPLFGQRLAGLEPLAAGFLGASLSMGWSIAQLATGRVSGAAAMRRLRIVAPAVVATGLALTALIQHEHAGAGWVAGWVLTLLLTGAGIGMGFARFAFPVMSSVEDPGEATKAAAGVNVVQVIATAFGSAIGGVLVNLGEPSTLDAARLLYGGLAVLALVGVVAGVASRRPLRETNGQPEQRPELSAVAGA